MGDEVDTATAEALTQLGTAIRDRRVDLKITQEQLAGRTGIDYKRIQRIEGGAVNITVRTLVRVALALEWEPRELLQVAAEQE